MPLSDFILILLFGLIVGWAASRFHQPAAVAQVLLGLVIGPPLLGWIHPGEALELIGQLGIALLLGMAGMHIGSRHLTRHGWTALWVAILGILLCFFGGYTYVVLWGTPYAEAIYVGIALTATSIGISVQVLHQLGLFDHKVGEIVIAAAVIDDVIALYLLATAHGMLSKNLASLQVIFSMFETALVLGIIYILCRWIAQRAEEGLAIPAYHVRLVVISVLIIAFGYITRTLGYSMVVGSFFAGLGLGDGIKPELRKRLSSQLGNVVPFFIPFFFVVIGSRAEWAVMADPGMPSLITGLLVVAIVGKILGGYIGALRAAGPGSSLLIGTSMAPRGEVVLVVAGLGYMQGHISHHMLVALILVTIGAALLSPLMMARIARIVT